MRIVYIIPGPAGPFFEKNSLREQALVAELRWYGHDVLFVPLLFPMSPSGAETASPAEEVPMLGGAVRVYLRLRLPFLSRHAPEWLWRCMGAPYLRNRLAKHVLASPRRLCDFIKDAMDGRNGALTDEIQALCEWLLRQRKPDVVLLSTPFLLGIAPMLKSALRVPVSCSMNSELEDIAHLRGPDAIIMTTKLRGIVGDSDGFIPSSQYHSERIQSRLGIPVSSTRPVHPGIDAEPFAFSPRPSSPAIGIIVRGESSPKTASPAMAVSSLRQIAVTSAVAIQVAREHHPMRQDHDSRNITDAGGSVETLPRSEEALRHFFSTLSVAVFIHSEPLPAFDFMILEALACGVPVVLPDSGANREIAALSDAVSLYEGVASMANAVAKILSCTPESQEAMRRTARHSVEHCFCMPRMAQETAEALQSIINRRAPAPELRPNRPAPGARQPITENADTVPEPVRALM